MSDRTIARRTAAKVVFAGTDISKSIEKYLISLTYTDNESDETDDLQIKLQDTEGIWLEKWLDTAIQSTAGGLSKGTSGSSSSGKTQYSVTADVGLNVRSGRGTEYKRLGTLPYGTVVEVGEIKNKWAEITYSGQTAYVHTDYLEAVADGKEDSGGGWKIGDSVYATGNPQYSSYGEGTPGAKVTNYSGKITNLNLQSGIPYPICVGYLGWFSEAQVTRQKVQKTEKKKEEAACKGLHIQAVIVQQNWNNDGKDNLLECGQFELDSVTAQGPPATIQIKATSLPYSASIRQTTKSKSWENYVLRGIVKEIAHKNGMAYMFLTERNPFYARVEQYRSSDIVFLSKLCNHAGCSLKVSNNIIIVFDKEKFEQKSVVRTIAHGAKGNYSKYKLATKSSDTYTSCEVSYTPSNGKTIRGTAYVDDYDEDDKKNQCLKIRQKVSSVGEAKTLAKKMLKLYNQFGMTASFTFPGDPTLLAGCTVKLTGWGAWNGKYIINRAVHTVSSSGYTTQIDLRKVV